MTIDPQKLARGLALYQQARELRGKGQLQAAADAFRQALQLAPDHPGILADYGQLAEDANDWKAAEQLYRRLLKVRNVTNLDGKLGYVLFQLERYEEAIPLLSAFLERNPAETGLHRILSTCHFRLFHLDEATHHARLAWEAERHPDAIALQLAVLIELGVSEPTAALVDEALHHFPDHWQIRKLAAEHLLKAGEFARGMPLFGDFRIPPTGRRHYLENVPVPTWDGARFDGTLLIGAEQGVGDEILTASLYVDIARLGQRAIIETDPRLLTLFRRSFPTLEFIDRRDLALQDLAAAHPGCRKIISGDLWALFRRQPDDFPATPGWLTADAARVQHFAEKYAAQWPGLPHIGISWRSQRVMKSGARKDVELTEFLPLLTAGNAGFVNLQYGDIGADLLTLGEHAGRLCLDPEVDTYNDIDALCAQTAALDLVITTSNVTAHVAGALGKPCWLLLPRQRPVIWYWGYRGERCVWYPSIRIFRNDSDNDWSGLFAGLADRLTRLPASLAGD